MAGVFAIFLLLKYFGHLPPRWVALGVIPVGIYALMLPLTHALFPLVSPWQHLSPLLSLGFVLFYPLAILLHLLGVGGWLDPLLQWLWHLPEGSVELRSLPLWTLPCYVALALLAVRRRSAFAGMGVAALGTLLWMGS
jgi:competence protein ComEC